MRYDRWTTERSSAITTETGHEIGIIVWTPCGDDGGEWMMRVKSLFTDTRSRWMFIYGAEWFIQRHCRRRNGNLFEFSSEEVGTIVVVRWGSTRATFEHGMGWWLELKNFWFDELEYLLLILVNITFTSHLRWHVLRIYPCSTLYWKKFMFSEPSLEVVGGWLLLVLYPYGIQIEMGYSSVLLFGGREVTEFESCMDMLLCCLHRVNIPGKSFSENKQFTWI